MSKIRRISDFQHEFSFLNPSDNFDIYFTGFLSSDLGKIHTALPWDELVSVLNRIKPEIVINCIGLIKQLPSAKDPLVALPINAMFSHRLAKLCELINSRLIHISTDCVFSGDKGFYVEEDPSDAHDLYGKSKYIGELHNMQHCITLRTSIIGHELKSNASLVDWFLSQEVEVRGYSEAIFSGMPTVELANVIRDYVIPRSDLYGLYHVSSDPIDKFSLLSLIAKSYDKKINIISDPNIKINRSLDSSKFREQTGFKPKSWDVLINDMFQFNLK
ncbi:MAG: SDR family oxidoreductase [Flavobacteriaceae bacterium]|nr:SDR family oxidoreductase [Flavobacteriaceae bacterium]